MEIGWTDGVKYSAEQEKSELRITFITSINIWFTEGLYSKVTLLLELIFFFSYWTKFEVWLREKNTKFDLIAKKKCMDNMNW